MTAAGGHGHRPGALAAVDTVDAAVDRWFESLRGRTGPDTAATVVSGLGDQGVLWMLVTAARGRRSGPARRAAVRALGVAGVSSALVNGGIKAVVGRTRPDRSTLELAGAVPLREPSTSSFPSGHTLAAFCAATVLSRPGHPAANVGLFAAAGAVGVSRIHLRAHHASDVAGGIAVGVALGLLGRRLL